MKLGLDIEYKHIYAVLTHNGGIVESVDGSIYSSERDSEEQIMEKVFALIEEVFRPEIEGIGISLPTKLDKKKGVVYDLEKIPHWKNIGIKNIIEEEFHKPTYINNDVNCFILGERHYGLCSSFKDVIGIYLDDNCGTSVLMDDKAFLGKHAIFKDIKCLSDAFYNHIHYYRKSYLKTIKDLSILCSCFEEEWFDMPDHYAWQDLGCLIGKLIAILLSNFNPKIIVLGGNLSRFYPYFSYAIDNCLYKFLHPEVLLNMILVTSMVKNPKPLGASTLCKKKIHVKM